MNRAKVLFVPGYLYLCARDFDKIAQDLVNQFDVAFLYIKSEHCNITRMNDVYGIPNFDYAENLILDLRTTLNLPEKSYTELINEKVDVKYRFYHKFKGKVYYDITKKIYIKLRGFLRYLRSYFVSLIVITVRSCAKKVEHSPSWNPIKAILQEQSPKYVVVNSDMGPETTRELLMLCSQMKIQTIIVPAADIECEDGSYLKKLLRVLLDTVGLNKSDNYLKLRARYYRTNVLGKYSPDSLVFTYSKIWADKLSSRGIDINRIRQFSLKPESQNSGKYEAKSARNKYRITFFSECLHEIYGADAVLKAHNEIALSLSKIKSIYGVEILVKPHPREIADAKILNDLITVPFTEVGISVDDRTETLKLIESSDLVIAHFSKVLIEACTKATPILSLAFHQQVHPNSFISGNVNSVCFLKNYDGLCDLVGRNIGLAEPFSTLREASKALGMQFRMTDSAIAPSFSDQLLLIDKK